MKALILAAGFGTRLLPYTLDFPKPLFTLNQRPVLDFAIERLMQCGCDQIFVNTHHCHEQIEAFVRQHRFKDKIQTIHEPRILDTGGAIANIQPFMDTDPFFVINADIFCNVDLRQVYEAHLANQKLANQTQTNQILATLVLHDYPEFNKIQVDEEGFIESFESPSGKGLAFTGIQVLSPDIYLHMPKRPGGSDGSGGPDGSDGSGTQDQKKFSSIDIYERLTQSKQIKAQVMEQIFWKDIGTIPSYVQTSQQTLSAHLLGLPENNLGEIDINPITGDGSDRLWFRAVHGKRSLVISDHGICMDQSDNLSQLKAFVSIGTHLASKNICVPQILGYDALSGQVALEDLGNIHLATLVNQSQNPTQIVDLYKNVIDHLIEFSQAGVQNFDTNWTCQTATYSKELILEKECAYFITAFIQDYLGKNCSFESYAQEFGIIADNALKYAHNGLMHRDMQSKNIMVHDEKIYFIDFQSARIGPLQYDLASLLIDPYVKLPQIVQEEMLTYTMIRLEIDSTIKQDEFKECYQYCCLTRNLQFLGAFAFLSRVKGKKSFESYIPHAVVSLKSTLRGMDRFPALSKLVNTL